MMSQNCESSLMTGYSSRPIVSELLLMVLVMIATVSSMWITVSIIPPSRVVIKVAVIIAEVASSPVIACFLSFYLFPFDCSKPISYTKLVDGTSFIHFFVN